MMFGSSSELELVPGSADAQSTCWVGNIGSAMVEINFIAPLLEQVHNRDLIKKTYADHN